MIRLLRGEGGGTGFMAAEFLRGVKAGELEGWINECMGNMQ